MSNYQNGGAFVTRQYVRVFTPTGVSEPRVRPACPDKLRDGADIREARARRQ